MPWNAKADARQLGPGIPKSDFWASDPKEGIDQVGCVYTAQGFEFDYVGVIFGPDLVYRPMDGGWVGQRDQSHDRVVRSGVTEQQFTDFVKSTYRVLLTRGLRGCYVYFMDAGDAGLRPEPDRATKCAARPVCSRASGDLRMSINSNDTAPNEVQIGRGTRKNIVDRRHEL